MNIAKHMEAIFIAAIVIVGAAAAAPRAAAAVTTVATVASVAGTMQVVTIVGKRLSAVEKSQLGE